MSDIKLFESKKIRSVWNELEHKWYFSVTDVVEVLTDSVDGKQYIKKLRQRDKQLNFYWGTICTHLEMIAGDAREALENETGRKVVSKENFLQVNEKRKRKLK